MADADLLLLLVGVLIAAVAMAVVVVGFAREARARRLAERRLGSLADTIPGALVQYRVYSDGRTRYEYLSEGAERLRGIDRIAAMRDPEVVLGTILEDDRRAFLAALADGGRTLERIKFDYRVRAPGGEVRWIRTSAAPRRLGDGSVRWSAYWSDVTDEKAIESELTEAKEAAESASRAKSTFLATMSHEIRTPMNGVLGMLELLALTELTADQRTALQVIRESGRSLQRIIDDILDFSKIEAGKLELRPETASIAEIVVRVRDIYAGNASSKGLLLRQHVDPRISPAVTVDPLRLQQVLNNLVSNAIKFTAQGEVELRADLLSRVDGEDVVRFTVSDTGVGMSPEEQATLFEPFSQAPGSRTVGGTGLGLSISRRLAQMMGGFILLDSRAGEGTTVTVTLPLPLPVAPAPLPAAAGAARLAQPARRAPPSVEQAEADGRLLLIVDDHPINRMVLFRQVNALGYAAECAENGLEALDLWSSGRFGALLSDVNMPEMDGYKLATHIRDCERRHGHAHTPIIACTANAFRGEAEKCMAAGMDDYMAKPIDLPTLAAKLQTWLPLGREPAASASAAVADEAVLDCAVLAEVAGEDPASQREILSHFRQFNAEDVVRLARAAENWDLRELQQVAHRIKGAARTIGALALAGACELLEQAARAGDLNAARIHMPSVTEELERLEDRLAAFEAIAEPRQPAAEAAR